MASEHAIPDEQSEKPHGDKLDHAVDTALNKGAGLAQDTAGKGTEPTPQQEPLK